MQLIITQEVSFEKTLYLKRFLTWIVLCLLPIMHGVAASNPYMKIGGEDNVEMSFSDSFGDQLRFKNSEYPHVVARFGSTINSRPFIITWKTDNVENVYFLA